MNRSRTAAIALAAACALVAGAAAQGTMKINGAGATFPYPLYSKWFSEYNKLHGNVEINYQSIGSGGGIQQVIKQTVFFGATDGPMTPEQQPRSPPRFILFPTLLPSVFPVFYFPYMTSFLFFFCPFLSVLFLV